MDEHPRYARTGVLKVQDINALQLAVKNPGLQDLALFCPLEGGFL